MGRGAMNNQHISSGAKELLNIITTAAEKTSDNFVFSVTLPTPLAKNRKALAEELIKLEYITHVKYHGQDKLQCQLLK
jgi:hypothetical protein